MKKISALIISLLLAAFMFSGCARKTVQKITLDADGYGKTVLGNGSIILVNHDKSTPLTSFRLLIAGGVLAETAENNGITNLMTRMLLKGNDQMNAAQITDSLDFLGANISIDCFRDYSTISGTVLSQYFDDVLGILATSLMSPTFPEEELDKLKSEVDGNIKSLDDSQSQASYKLFWKTVYGDKGYGLPLLGTAESIAKINASDIRTQYEQFIGGPNLIFSLASDKTPDELLPVIEKTLGMIGSTARDVPKPNLQLQAEKNGFIKYDRNQSFIYTGVMLDKPRPIEVAYLRLLNEIMGNNVGSRLWYLRQTEKLAYAVYTQYAVDKYDAAFLAALGTDTSKVKTALSSLNREWAALVSDGVLADELTDAVTNMNNNLIYSIDKKNNRANNMAYYEYVGYGYRFVLDMINMTDDIRLEDLNTYIKSQFNDNRRYTAVVGKM